MASAYTNDLRLEEITTGEQSGTWGDTTNTNLELISEAFSFGTEAITSNADTHTTTIADGATDPGRSMYLKYTGALDSTCTITIGPNTVSKLWFIENATTDSGSSGPYDIIIKQGTGATVTVPNGHVKTIYSDGAGAGGAMVEAFTDLNVANSLTVSGTTPSITIGDAGAEDTKIVFDGNAKDFYVGLDDSADKLVIGEGSTVGTNNILTITDDTVTLGDGAAVDTSIVFDGNAKDFYIALDDSADKLLIGEGSTVGTNPILSITDDTVTLGDGAAVDTAIVFDGNAQDFYIALDDSADDLLIGLGSTVGTTPIISVDENKDVAIPDGGLTITTSDNTDTLTLVSTDADANSGPNFRLYRNSSSPADSDILGQVDFDGRNDNSQDFIGVQIVSSTGDVSDGSEDAQISFDVMTAGTLREYLRMASGSNPAVIMNQDSRDINFQVLSDGNDNMLFVDGGENRVGIGTGTPSTDVHIFSAADNAPHLLLENFQNADTDDAAVIELYLNDQTTGGIGDDTDVGVIRFTGDEKDGGTKETYAEIRGVAHDPGQGSANKGHMSFFVQAAGALNETMTLDESRVGIGVADPAELLHIKGSNAAQKIRIERREVDGILSDNDEIGAIEFWTNEDTYASGASAVRAKIMAEIENTSSSTNLQIFTGGSTSAPTEAVRIDGGGKAFFGDSSFGGTAAVFAIEVPASGAGSLIRVDSAADANETMLQFQDAASQGLGSITSNPSANTTAYNTSSDGRLKDITGEAKGLEIINELNPVAFTWKSSGVKAEGLIAQEVEKLVDHAVSKTKESEYLQMDYSKLVTPLIKAVQELSAEVEELKQQAHEKCEN